MNDGIIELLTPIWEENFVSVESAGSMGNIKEEVKNEESAIKILDIYQDNQNSLASLARPDVHIKEEMEDDELPLEIEDLYQDHNGQSSNNFNQSQELATKQELPADYKTFRLVAKSSEESFEEMDPLTFINCDIFLQVTSSSTVDADLTPAMTSKQEEEALLMPFQSVDAPTNLEKSLNEVRPLTFISCEMHLNDNSPTINKVDVIPHQDIRQQYAVEPFQSSADPAHLQKFLETSEEIKPFTFVQCGTFSNDSASLMYQEDVLPKSDLSDNIKSELVDVNNAGYSESAKSICGNEFSHERGLTSHQPNQVNHTNPTTALTEFKSKEPDAEKLPQGKFDCKICNIRFHALRTLSQHKRTVCPGYEHSGDRKQSRSANNYKCTECDAFFAYEKDLHNHIKTHRVCEICNVGFQTLGLLQTHKCRFHSFRCSFCKKTFKDEGKFVKHERVHKTYLTTALTEFKSKEPGAEKQPQGKFDCNICNIRFHALSTLTRHKRTACPGYTNCGDRKQDSSANNYKFTNNYKHYKCTKCDASFDYVKELRNHMKTHIVCEICNVGFQTLGLLLTHKRQLHPFRCSFCTKTFKDEGRFLKHESVHKKDNTYACELCDITFDSEVMLTFHKRFHDSEESFGCSQCEQRFDSIEDCRKHKKTHVLKKYYVYETCDVAGDKKVKELFNCKEQFDDRTYCEKHETTQNKVCTTFNSGESLDGQKLASKRFKNRKTKKLDKSLPKCDICNFSFSSSAALKGHERRCHTARKTFTCSRCKKEFDKATERIEHEKTHNVDKGHTCRLCNITFNAAISLFLHKCAAEVRKEYGCPKCEMKFTTLKECSEHEKSHKVIKTYACKTCGKVFATNASLSLHTATHTSVQNPNN